MANRFLLGAAAVALLFSSCASPPNHDLSAVQKSVSAAGGPTLTWPQTAPARSEIDRVVQTWLAQDLTPEIAVEIAVLNNRTLRATFEEIGLSQADLLAAGQLHNPTFAASVRWPDQKPRGPNVEFSLAADVLDGLLIPLRRRLAGEALTQASQRVAFETLALISEVKIACYTLQARQQFRVRLQASAGVNDAAADLAQRQYDAGNINLLELTQHQTQSEVSAVALIRIDAQLQSDREKINRLLGLSASTNGWKISAELPALPRTETDGTDWESIAVRQRLDLMVARSQVSTNQSALSLQQKTRLLPLSVSLGVDTEREANGQRLTGPTAELSLPLFNQGQAETARLEAQLRRATARAEGLETDIRSEVREAQSALLAAHAVAEAYVKTLLPQRAKILRETLLHYNAMQKSNYELFAAKEQQLEAERESLEAQRDYWIAHARLERAVGGPLGSRVKASIPNFSSAAALTDTDSRSNAPVTSLSP